MNYSGGLEIGYGNTTYWDYLLPPKGISYVPENSTVLTSTVFIPSDCISRTLYFSQARISAGTPAKVTRSPKVLDMRWNLNQEFFFSRQPFIKPSTK
jgi:hypothetical protein